MKIGDVVEYQGKKYRMVKKKIAGYCNGCAFFGKYCTDFKNSIEEGFYCTGKGIIFELVEEKPTVYGKKIKIGGAEYVAIPEIPFYSACDKCVFDNASVKECGKIREKCKELLGIDCENGDYILKKITPKKKPEQKCVIKFSTESTWGKTAAPNVINEVYGQPYLNPVKMMQSNQTVLIDDTPYKIERVDKNGSSDGITYNIEFRQAGAISPVQFHKFTVMDLLLRAKNGVEIPNRYSDKIITNDNRYIVCLADSGELKPSDTPKQHKSEFAATNEAERLCKLHKQKFVVLKVIAEVEPEIKPKLTKC
jgi:hypothetical protein